MTNKKIVHTARWSFDLNEGIEKSNRLTSSQLKIYGFIYGFNVKKSTCKVSFDGLVRGAEVVRSTAQVAVGRLETLGWITVAHGACVKGGARNECNIYSIKKWPKIKKAIPKPIERKQMTEEQKQAVYIESAKRVGIDPADAYMLLRDTKTKKELLALEFTFDGLKKSLSYYQQKRSINTPFKGYSA